MNAHSSSRKRELTVTVKGRNWTALCDNIKILIWMFNLRNNKWFSIIQCKYIWFQISYGSEMTQQSGLGVDDSSNDALVIVDDPLLGGSTQGQLPVLYKKELKYLFW